MVGAQAALKVLLGSDSLEGAGGGFKFFFVLRLLQERRSCRYKALFFFYGCVQHRRGAEIVLRCGASAGSTLTR